ncbi:hypothetical protein E1A91_A13G183100v1 [Gossypium mustelinum]|uniref:Benzyl alcohol O-benzoyltransferase-like n=1 Tax=Gossypium mustelinum TaxID=34275 RepID=A0A5D2WJM0_GOSMU|nr:hypothetical protein E1A91_A13G183100v1 [Gossypium mustelinum]
MAIASSIPLVFSVQRCKPELVAPTKPTPHEHKLLSDIDDQAALRFQVPFIQFYEYNPSMQGKDPAEGVMFIKADADVTLEQFGNALHPPFPCFDELLYDVPDSERMLNCPLLLIQVTRLKCGSFIFAIRFNHVICDGIGLKQFMSTISEMARDEVEPTAISWPLDNLVQRSFFFGPAEVSTLRSLLPLHLCHCTTKFELLTACLWRCRTIALNLNPNEKVRMLCTGNLRSKFNPSLPLGYYGNVIVFPAAITTVRNLLHNPLGYTVELVKQAKASMTKEYAKSVAALMVLRAKQLNFTKIVGSFVVSDLTKIGFEDIDFGWGKAVFAGAAKAVGVISFFVSTKSTKGEVGTSVPICLPAPAMERFEKELDNMLKGHLLGF